MHGRYRQFGPCFAGVLWSPPDGPEYILVGGTLPNFSLSQRVFCSIFLPPPPLPQLSRVSVEFIIYRGSWCSTSRTTCTTPSALRLVFLLTEAHNLFLLFPDLSRSASTTRTSQSWLNNPGDTYGRGSTSRILNRGFLRNLDGVGGCLCEQSPLPGGVGRWRQEVISRRSFEGSVSL